MAGVLLVHGAWHGPWCWDGFAERLAGHGHQVQAVRLRGHDQPPGRIWHRVHHYVTDVRQAAARFAQPPVLVGHSLGALVVQRYLEHGPARAAVLLAPPPHRGTLAAIARLAIGHPMAMLQASLSLRLRPLVATPALVRELFFSPDTPQELVDDTFARVPFAARDAVAGQAARLRRLRRAAGRRDQALTVAAGPVTVVDQDADAARSVAASGVAWYLCAMGDVYARFVADQGYGDEVQAILAANPRPSPRHGVVPADAQVVLDQLTAHGTAAQVREQLTPGTRPSTS
jgi:pimeloyl-ACP methyl ester carboxylesterase